MSQACLRKTSLVEILVGNSRINKIPAISPPEASVSQVILLNNSESLSSLVIAQGDNSLFSCHYDCRSIGGYKVTVQSGILEA